MNGFYLGDTSPSCVNLKFLQTPSQVKIIVLGQWWQAYNLWHACHSWLFVIIESSKRVTIAVRTISKAWESLCCGPLNASISWPPILPYPIPTASALPSW